MYHLTLQTGHGSLTLFVDQKHLLFFTSNSRPLKLVDFLFVLLDFSKESGQEGLTSFNTYQFQNIYDWSKWS